VGTSEKKRYFPALAIDSQLSRRFGMPTGRWENYLRSSSSVACPRQVGGPLFQAKAGGGEGSAHVNGQAQTAGHSISRVGAEGSPASRAEAHREKGRFTIGVRL
jgi:hypothetical protein